MAIKSIENLYGCWELVEARFQTEPGAWEKEKVYGGNTYFTRSGMIGTFTRTSDLAYGYTGTFTLHDGGFSSTPQVCSIVENEGKKIFRRILALSTEGLTLGLIDEATGRRYEFEFRLLTRNF